jgi:DUF971 family protein
MNGTVSTDPEHIAISKSKGIRIDWKDNHHSEYGLNYLRDRCPCATCTGAHGTPPRQPSGASPEGPFPMFKPRLTMLGVEPVGNYAIRVSWSDGHSTGIYSYEHLRRICPCDECRKA